MPTEKCSKGVETEHRPESVIGAYMPKAWSEWWVLKKHHYSKNCFIQCSVFRPCPSVSCTMHTYVCQLHSSIDRFPSILQALLSDTLPPAGKMFTIDSGCSPTHILIFSLVISLLGNCTDTS